MKIDFYSRENCPFDPNILWGRGLGGSEMALVFLAEALAKKGHDVTVWNDRHADEQFSGVNYRSLKWVDYNAISTDLFVIFRVSIPSPPLRAKRTVFLSTDQATDQGWNRMLPWLERFICISDFHANYIAHHWSVHPDNVYVCELGVNQEDYVGNLMKVEGRCIFCSVPHRGLDWLLRLWPKIADAVPQASLVITCDYRLWGRSNDPGNREFVAQAAGMPGVTLLGAVPRSQLVEWQKSAVLMPYPCTYDENFCISAMECIAAGAVPVTTPVGALPTTVGHSGVVLETRVEANPSAFQQEVISLLLNPARRNVMAVEGRKRALTQYTYEEVANRFLMIACAEHSGDIHPRYYPSFRREQMVGTNWP